MRRGLVSEVFATEAAMARFGALLADAPVQLVTERAAKALSETVTPVGLVAVCSVPETALDDVLAKSPRLVAVAAEISEPGNAGTLIRVAHAMGADAVVLAGHSVDPYNGKCLRASAGSIFSIPVVSEEDAAAAVSALKAAGLDGAGHHRRRRSHRSMTRTCRRRRHGCSGRKRTAWRPNWLTWPRTAFGSRCRAARKASTSRRPPRSACIKVHGRTAEWEVSHVPLLRMPGYAVAA